MNSLCRTLRQSGCLCPSYRYMYVCCVRRPDTPIFVHVVQTHGRLTRPSHRHMYIYCVRRLHTCISVYYVQTLIRLIRPSYRHMYIYIYCVRRVDTRASVYVVCVVRDGSRGCSERDKGPRIGNRRHPQRRWCRGRRGVS